MSDTQFGRRASLTVAGGATGLDLSEFHFRFQVSAADEESPNSAVIRVYNLADDTIRKVTAEFTRVVLQAGYVDGGFGVIFDGTIKQYRVGKENATDRYLDILAAENDLEYNFGVSKTTLAAGATPVDQLKVATKDMGLQMGEIDAKIIESSGVYKLSRGKVMWGMSRAQLRAVAESVGATWNIENGKVNVTTLQGYRPGEAVVISASTGMIGIPEQTDDGIRVRTLLNPRYRIGGLVKIDNAAINQILQADLRADPLFTERNITPGQVVYNSRKGALSFPANVRADGNYRVYVIEYSGDTRGQDWYCDLICLAVDLSANKVSAPL